MQNHPYVARFGWTRRDLFLMPTAALFAAVVPGHLPADLVANSRPVNFWRLDTERLAAAVAYFAPHVRVVDEG